MATDYSDWSPVTMDSKVLGPTYLSSAIQRLGVAHTMTAKVHEVPRQFGHDVGGGDVYAADTNDGDVVQLRAYKFTGRSDIADEDISDAVADVIRARTNAWLASYSVAFDNASIGVTGAASTTDSDFRPFTSIYKAVRTTDSDLGYTADTNYEAGALDYDNLNEAVGRLENGQYWAPDQTIVIAHPSLRQKIRGLKDQNGVPIFVGGTGGRADGQVAQDSILGLEIVWSHGARTSANFSSITGNPLFVVVNRQALLRGDRIEPEVMLLDRRVNADSDVNRLKFRARKAFALAHPEAASVLEITS